MIQPTLQEISPLEIRHITTFVKEHPEVIELLVDVWNQATWFRTHSSTNSPVIPSKPQ